MEHCLGVLGWRKSFWLFRASGEMEDAAVLGTVGVTTVQVRVLLGPLQAEELNLSALFLHKGRYAMHWKYLKYVLRHKWYVFIECCRMGIPFQGIVHDWQKFTPTEWSPYAESFYGLFKYSARPQSLVESFDNAWLHNIHLGPHHWQYWVLREDSGSTKVLNMPLKYKKEMLADWRGAGRAINGKDDTRQWYLNNREKMMLHPDVTRFVESELSIIEVIS